VGTRNYRVVVPLVFCENRNIGVLKQAFEEELGFAMPQIYRRQVAEFAKLYQGGRAEEIQTRSTNSVLAQRMSELLTSIPAVLCRERLR